MALIKCPECGKQISNMADECPHCGYPLNNTKEEVVGESPKNEPPKNEEPVTTEEPKSETAEQQKPVEPEQNPESKIGKPEKGHGKVIGAVVGSIAIIAIAIFFVFSLTSSNGISEEELQGVWYPDASNADKFYLRVENGEINYYSISSDNPVETFQYEFTGGDTIKIRPDVMSDYNTHEMSISDKKGIITFTPGVAYTTGESETWVSENYDEELGSSVLKIEVTDDTTKIDETIRTVIEIKNTGEDSYKDVVVRAKYRDKDKNDLFTMYKTATTKTLKPGDSEEYEFVTKIGGFDDETISALDRVNLTILSYKKV